MNGKIASEIKQIYNLQILQSVHSINSDLQLPRAHRGPRNGVRSCSTMLPKWNKICCVHCTAGASFLEGITNNNKRNRKSVVPNFFEVKMKRDSCREEPLPITLGEKIQTGVRYSGNDFNMKGRAKSHQKSNEFNLQILQSIHSINRTFYPIFHFPLLKSKIK